MIYKLKCDDEVVCVTDELSMDEVDFEVGDKDIFLENTLELNLSDEVFNGKDG